MRRGWFDEYCAGELAIIETMATNWELYASFFALEENAPPVSVAQFAELMRAMTP